jgi:hypothetical protein
MMTAKFSRLLAHTAMSIPMLEQAKAVAIKPSASRGIEILSLISPSRVRMMSSSSACTTATTTALTVRATTIQKCAKGAIMSMRITPDSRS